MNKSDHKHDKSKMKSTVVPDIKSRETKYGYTLHRVYPHGNECIATIKGTTLQVIHSPQVQFMVSAALLLVADEYGCERLELVRGYKDTQDAGIDFVSVPIAHIKKRGIEEKRQGHEVVWRFRASFAITMSTAHKKFLETHPHLSFLEMASMY